MMKFKNQFTFVEGIRFDSRKEAARWLELKTLERAGKLSDLRRQVRFELLPKFLNERSVTYVADFVYVMDGASIVEDVKGIRTREYIIKRKLFKFRYPGYVFREV